MKRLGYIFVLTLVLLLVTCGCSRIKSKYEAVKERIKDEINDLFRTDFYSDCGAWDYYRVPLIAPYALIAIGDRNIWNCEKRHDIDEFGGDCLCSARLSVEYVGISDSIIYMHYTKALSPLDKMPGHTYGSWEMRQFVIIDVPADSVEWYETRGDWLSALRKRNITNPQLHHVDSVYDDFANNRRLLFNPTKR